MEADVTAAYAGLGVARVVERRADNRVVLDRRYVPPVLDVGADPTLAGVVRDIHGLLHQRGDALAERFSQPGPGGVAEIADFLWLETINRFEPVFAHLAATTPLHPERLYAVCLMLAGELSTFTREGRRPVAYPVYRHDDLAGSFAPVVADHPPLAVDGAGAQRHPDRARSSARTAFASPRFPMAICCGPPASCWPPRRSCPPSDSRPACRRS